MLEITLKFETVMDNDVPIILALSEGRHDKSCSAAACRGVPDEYVVKVVDAVNQCIRALNVHLHGGA